MVLPCGFGVKLKDNENSKSRLDQTSQTHTRIIKEHLNLLLHLDPPGTSHPPARLLLHRGTEGFPSGRGAILLQAIEDVQLDSGRSVSSAKGRKQPKHAQIGLTLVRFGNFGKSPFALGESCMRNTMAIIAIAQIPTFTS
jgi:hypothetical protein